ncbi:UNVERIFIED_CONTAM: hypothetical protein NCL1_35036 [Trichonephila clavipes]
MRRVKDSMRACFSWVLWAEKNSYVILKAQVGKFPPVFSSFFPRENYVAAIGIPPVGGPLKRDTSSREMHEVCDDMH